MKVKNIFSNVCKYLNLDELFEYCNDQSISPSQDVLDDYEKMLLAINMTNTTIASLYFDILEEKQIVCMDGKIKYSNITDKDIVDIKYVLDTDGNKINYSAMSDGINLNDGTYKIVYSYLPKEVEIDDEITYYRKISEALFSYGVVAEFLFLKGDLNEAYIWDKKFKEELFALSRPRKNINMPCKRWY